MALSPLRLGATLDIRFFDFKDERAAHLRIDIQAPFNAQACTQRSLSPALVDNGLSRGGYVHPSIGQRLPPNDVLMVHCRTIARARANGEMGTAVAKERAWLGGGDGTSSLEALSSPILVGVWGQRLDELSEHLCAASRSNEQPPGKNTSMSPRSSSADRAEAGRAFSSSALAFARLEVVALCCAPASRNVVLIAS
jgi:hypothetical protein